MGMFDSVIVTCPNCYAEVEFQSKGGKCDLERHSSGLVPIEIAVDLYGSSETCGQCKSVVYLYHTLPPLVKMYSLIKIGVDKR